MMKKVIPALLIGGLVLTGCSKEEPEESAPTSMSTPTTVTKAKKKTEDLPDVDPNDLPTVDNTRIDRTDPDDVAKKFILLSTTFAPGREVDERKEVERGYPLTTSHYRDNHKPLEPNPAIVRTRSWYNQKTSYENPVRVVVSQVGWADRPVPVKDDDKRAIRSVHSVQTPITESGRKLSGRTRDWEVTVVKQDNNTWLVDDAVATEVED